MPPIAIETSLLTLLICSWTLWRLRRTPEWYFLISRAPRSSTYIFDENHDFRKSMKIHGFLSYWDPIQGGSPLVTPKTSSSSRGIGKGSRGRRRRRKVPQHVSNVLSVVPTDSRGLRSFQHLFFRISPKSLYSVHTTK